MRDFDNDLEDLDHLLGHAKADYRALRHQGGLDKHRAKTSWSAPLRRYAIAASMLVAALAVAFFAIELDGGLEPEPAKPSRLAISRPAEIPLSLRPVDPGRASFSVDRSQLVIGLRLPRRPSGSNG